MVFTKKELEYMLYCVDSVGHASDDEYEELFNKLQSMVDNHCEHDWRETFTEREVCRCFNCGKESL